LYGVDRTEGFPAFAMMIRGQDAKAGKSNKMGDFKKVN
jgi:hypothetical protein